MKNREPKRYTVTAALPYANGSKHIGHLAGAYLPADIFVRLKRSQQKDVVFICGSDENGAAIEIQAMKENSTPQEIIEKYHYLTKSSFESLGIAFDVYHRTSDPLHHQTAQAFFTTLYEKGCFEEQTTAQYFDEKANTFLADRYITGTCPNCAYQNAFGDQCEKCGKALSPTELINPRSTLSDATPVLKETKHWYLPLDRYEGILKEYILEKHKDDWKPNAYGQSKSWIDAGLQSRAMTRDLKWGIDVPLEQAKGKKLYVWFDAPIGYISATKALFAELESGNLHYAYPQIKTEVKADDWKKYWQSEDAKLLHFVGKDNIVFHCIIFPLILNLHGDYIMADNVPANEFLNLEGDKMSTSRQWSVEMHDYINEFPGKADVLRYCLISNMPETKDSEFTWRDFQTKNNSELVAILGNLVNRVVVLTHKFFDGKVPDEKPCDDLSKFLTEQKNKVATAIDHYHFRDALLEMMNVARHGNKLLTEKEPWKKFKTDPAQTAIDLYDCIQLIANLAILCEPFLPFTAQKLRNVIGLKGEYSWDDIGNAGLVAGNTTIGSNGLLFDKIEDDVIDKQLAKLEAIKQMNIPTETKESKMEIAPQRDEIVFDEFSKLDLRVGTILAAEKVEKADKLLKIEVDLGFEKRTIVSGIAPYFQPADIVGKQVMVVANLAPRKLRGIDSKGMILLAEKEDGSLEFATVLNSVPNGSIVR
jgi:methionyl-tRNA synthetase